MDAELGGLLGDLRPQGRGRLVQEIVHGIVPSQAVNAPVAGAADDPIPWKGSVVVTAASLPITAWDAACWLPPDWS
jgi:hypothetical protein